MYKIDFFFFYFSHDVQPQLVDEKGGGHHGDLVCGLFPF